MQSNIKNRNGRVYPKKFLQKKLRTTMKTLLKETEHLENLVIQKGPTVNLDRVSHMITSLKQDGDNFIGEAKIMGTPG